MLIIELIYKKPIDESLTELVKEHRNYLQLFYDKGLFLVSGRKKPLTGGFIIADISKEIMQSIIENDPFSINKIAEYKITEFYPSNCCDELKSRVVI